ncbi:MAG: hypothetical protein HN348_29075 [Proteobacteria bacterium]|nr:hypothetical protein [Pseudomonadota bacterium]
MKLKTLVCVGALALGTLACGGGPVDMSSYSVDMTAPWDGMDLPTSDGSVIYSDDTTLSLNYDDGADAAALAKEYTGAIEKQGWTKDIESATDDVVSVNFKKDGKTLVFNVASVPALGMTTVSLTVLDF